MFSLYVATFMTTSLVIAAQEEVKSEAFTEYKSGPQCTDTKERKCHAVPKKETYEECHIEQDIVYDTIYEEKCEDVIKKRCTETSELVHENYLKRYSGHGSVLFETRPQSKQFSEPECVEEKENVCTKIPKQQIQAVPKDVCENKTRVVAVEECNEVIVTDCINVEKEIHREIRILGTESYLLDKSKTKIGAGDVDHSNKTSYIRIDV